MLSPENMVLISAEPLWKTEIKLNKNKRKGARGTQSKQTLLKHVIIILYYACSGLKVCNTLTEADK